MTQRKYREGEVREIFELATSTTAADARTAPAADGLTLADIQSIGLEVGVEPDAIARAAATLDARAARPLRKSWGMPIEVSRTVPLSRPLTDTEWHQLVGELRTTFGARGTVTVQGGLREWSNGNLYVWVEPSENGHRLRLNTIKGNAAPVNALGATGVIAGAVMFGSLVGTGGLQDTILLPMMLTASGVAAWLSNLLRLPRWSAQRQQQMDHIAECARMLTQESPGQGTLPP